MSDYMLTPAFPDARVERGDFEGYPLRLLFVTGYGESVMADDAIAGIGSDMTRELLALFSRRAQMLRVRVDGEVRDVRVISLPRFFEMCQLNPSPRLDAFRARVAGMLVQIHTTGCYIPDTRVGSPVAAPPVPAANLDPALAQTAVLRGMLDQLDSFHREHVQLKASQLQIEGRVQAGELDRREDRARLDRVTRAVTQEVGVHCLVSWAEGFGIVFEEYEDAKEGGVCRRICDRMGLQSKRYDHPRYALHPTGKKGGINKWPDEVLWVWLDDYSARHPRLRETINRNKAIAISNGLGPRRRDG